VSYKTKLTSGNEADRDKSAMRELSNAKTGEHAKTAHHMKEIAPDVLDKARSVIRDEGKARGRRGGS
jgi:predicted small metal-binding protein